MAVWYLTACSPWSAMPPLEDLLAAGAGKLLVLLEGFVEFLAVHGHAVLGGQFLGELDGESVGIVKLERQAAGHDLLGIFEKVGKHLFELVLALLEGFKELLFLSLQLIHHAGAVFRQLGVRTAELGDDDLRDACQKHAVDAELASVADGAADEAAQDVTGPDVGGADGLGVAEDEGRRAGVVADNSDGFVHFPIASVRVPGKLLHRRDDWGENLGFVD